jgi:hypothetical protein
MKNILGILLMTDISRQLALAVDRNPLLDYYLGYYGYIG